ncbi:MAG: hypothetical protein KF754_15100 [Planctomycetes bacterium]|nr:hypothetical protein [Planctomycetota bacterium]
MRVPALLVCVVLLCGGCMAVLGYEPTDEELEAIRRGEDPRANEGKPGNEKPGPADNRPRAPEPEPDRQPGPDRGVVLRWVDASTVVIEADARSMVVRIPGEFASIEAESRAFNDRMNKWTYGTEVRLVYPLRDAGGQPKYRDAEGNLLAEIHAP